MKIILRNLENQDFKPLYEYMINPQNQILFTGVLPFHTFSQFQDWLTERLRFFYHDFFIISTSNQEAIGFTFSYDFHELDQHCKYTLCLFEQSQRKGYGPAAAIKMMDYLFRTYPLNQIFISVYEYNTVSLNLNLKAGFKEVGVLPCYRYYNGKRYSLYILVMNRSDFYDSVTRLYGNIMSE